MMKKTSVNTLISEDQGILKTHDSNSITFLKKMKSYGLRMIMMYGQVELKRIGSIPAWCICMELV